MQSFRLRTTALAKNFREGESGAVTVDWVVLTAALIGIALTLLSTVRAGIDEAATDIRNQLNSAYSG